MNRFFIIDIFVLSMTETNDITIAWMDRFERRRDSIIEPVGHLARSLPGARRFYAFICLKVYFFVFFSAVIFIFRWISLSVLLTVRLLWELYTFLNFSYCFRINCLCCALFFV